MLVTQQKVLRRFWYPVIPADRLTDAPAPFTLLGTKLVLFRDGAGKAWFFGDKEAHDWSSSTGAYWASNAVDTPGRPVMPPWPSLPELPP